MAFSVPLGVDADESPVFEHVERLFGARLQILQMARLHERVEVVTALVGVGPPRRPQFLAPHDEGRIREQRHAPNVIQVEMGEDDVPDIAGLVSQALHLPVEALLRRRFEERIARLVGVDSGVEHHQPLRVVDQEHEQRDGDRFAHVSVGGQMVHVGQVSVPAVEDVESHKVPPLSSVFCRYLSPG